MTDLLREAIADAKTLQDAALDKAKAVILETYAPAIKRLVEQQFKQPELKEEAEEDPSLEIDEKLINPTKDTSMDQFNEYFEDLVEEMLSEAEEPEEELKDTNMEDQEEVEVSDMEGDEEDEDYTEEEIRDAIEAALDELSEEELAQVADMIGELDSDSDSEDEDEYEDEESEEDLDNLDEIEDSMLWGEPEEYTEAMDPDELESAVYEAVSKLSPRELNKLESILFEETSPKARKPIKKIQPSRRPIASGQIRKDKLSSPKEETRALTEAKKSLQKMEGDMQAIMLENQRLAYSTRLLTTYSLTQDQKGKVLEAFDNASTGADIKKVYSRLNEALKKRPKQVSKSLKESFASRPMTSTKPKEDTSVVSRLKELAGIISL